MNPDAIALPPQDDRLTGDLCSVMYTYTSDGRIKVESKDDVRKRLKRSTDGADAVALALYMSYLATAKSSWEGVYKRIKFTYVRDSSEDFISRRRNAARKVRTLPRG